MQPFQMQNRRLGKVLHIAAHLGEGVGKAIGGIALSDQKYEHEIILLEAPRKMMYVDACRAQGVNVYIEPDADEFKSLAANADAIVLSWWNHPLTLPVLKNLADIPARIVLWCHVNGCYYPRLPFEFACLFEGCMFTSPVSLELPYWTKNDIAQIALKSEMVYGLGNFKPKQQTCKFDYNLHDPIRIGYVGTLDYAKMHPEFLNYCQAVLRLGIKAEFIMVGEPSEALTKDVREQGLESQVRFLGYRKDVSELLPGFDIFGYLLNTDNFATTENALLEAMAAGLPVVVSSGDVERAIVTDEYDGLLAQGPDEYAAKIQELVENKGAREKLGKTARRTVCAKYESEGNLDRFHKAIYDVLGREKQSHDFKSVLGKSVCEGFFYFCPPEAREIFKNAVSGSEWVELGHFTAKVQELGPIFRTDKKGSPLQFLRYYPEDAGLVRICELFK